MLHPKAKKDNSVLFGQECKLSWIDPVALSAAITVGSKPPIFQLDCDIRPTQQAMRRLCGSLFSVSMFRNSTINVLGVQ